MKRLFARLAVFAGVLALLAPLPATAQVQSTTKVVGTCGTQTYVAGTMQYPTQDTTGTACVTGGGSGGGGAVTAAAGSYATGFSSDIGTLVSPNPASLLGLLTALNTIAAAPLAAGTAIIGKVGIDQTTPGTTNGVSLTAGTAIAGKVGIDQTTPGTTNGVVLNAAAVGGATSYGLQATASTNSTSVKGSAGTLYGMHVYNTTTTIYYLRMYDASAAPTCSSATGFSRTFPIVPAAAAGGGGGSEVKLPEMGVNFASGIAFCATGGPSSTDNTNAAVGVFINLDYK